MTNVEVLPQRWPNVLDQSPGHRPVGEGEPVRITLFASAQVTGFSGHFPQFALLPGVVQVDWASHFAQRVFGLSNQIISVERLKFTCPIQPNNQVILELIKKEFTVEFRFFAEISANEFRDYSQGRLVFLAT